MRVEKNLLNSLILFQAEERAEIAGHFTAKFAKRISFPVKITVFCGPASFRDPEADNCWHPYMIRSGVAVFVKDQLPLFMKAIGGGIRRFLTGCFGRFHYIENDGATVLGVSPTSICSIKDGKVETSYCHEDDTDRIAWFLIDEKEKEPGGYPVSRVAVIRWFLRMLGSWFYVTLFGRQEERRGDWFVVSVLTLRWIMSLLWVNAWMLELALETLLKDSCFKKVFCVHEMHPQARVACSVSRRIGVPFRVLQHASINRSKLWYFPVRQELASGLTCPDEFVVFSDDVITLLKPYYPSSTAFSLGCSNRYAHWKTKTADYSPRNNNGGVLFVTSLSWWDNAVVLDAVSRLLDEAYTDRLLRVRLHPHAFVPSAAQSWFDEQVTSGEICRSVGSLEQDIAASSLVVGMTTTVLEEAALLGKPIITLQSSDYLSFEDGIGPICSADSFSARLVEDTIRTFGTDDLHVGICASRRLLGIDQPVARVS